MATKGTTIKDSTHLSNPASTVKIPVSDGSGTPKHVTVGDIDQYVTNKQIGTLEDEFVVDMREEADFEALTADNTISGVLYFGLEPIEGDVTTTYDETTGQLTDSEADYDSETGQMTLASASFDSETGYLTL